MQHTALTLLQCSLGLAQAELDAQIAIQNQQASAALADDILAGIARHERRGHIEFSCFTPRDGRP